MGYESDRFDREWEDAHRVPQHTCQDWQVVRDGGCEACFYGLPEEPETAPELAPKEPRP